MERAKVSLNLIPNPKSRVSTFKKRKNSLMKKAYELSTLCDVPVCVLIHGPQDHHHHHRHQLRTWPPDRSHVRALIRACTTNPNLHKCKSFDLSDYFEDRRAKLLADTCKLCEKHRSLCPNPTETYLDCLNESQLRAFMDSLDSKLEAASAMLELMEPNQPLPIFTPEDDTNTALLQSLFVEDDDPDQIRLCFDDLPSLFPELDHIHSSSNDNNNSIVGLMNHPSQFYHNNNNNDLDHLFMPANSDQFRIDNNFEYLVMPTNNDERLFDMMMPMPMPEDDPFVFGCTERDHDELLGSKTLLSF